MEEQQVQPSQQVQATQQVQYTPYVEKKKKSPVLFGILALFLMVVVYVTATLSRGTTNFFGRAANSGVFNATNSYVFASPLTARKGGDKIRITVFALDGQGKGIPNETVTVNCKDITICQSANIVIESIQASTDNLGQAIFDISSPVQGKFELQATVNTTLIPQTVTINYQ